jgi:hypothetical protein
MTPEVGCTELRAPFGRARLTRDQDRQSFAFGRKGAPGETLTVLVEPDPTEMRLPPIDLTLGELDQFQLGVKRGR